MPPAPDSEHQQWKEGCNVEADLRRGGFPHFQVFSLPSSRGCHHLTKKHHGKLHDWRACFLIWSGKKTHTKTGVDGANSGSVLPPSITYVFILLLIFSPVRHHIQVLAWGDVWGHEPQLLCVLLARHDKECWQSQTHTFVKAPQISREAWLFSGGFIVSYLSPGPLWQATPSRVKHRWLFLSLCLGATVENRRRRPPLQPAVVKSWHRYEGMREKRLGGEPRFPVGSSGKLSPSAHLGQSCH